MPEETKIVIVGGGFGGVYAALELEKLLRHRSDVHVTLISQDNFMLFTPMLHEVASGDLSPENIVNPIRKLLRRIHFVEADVKSIDLAAKRIDALRGLRCIPLSIEFDHLLLASGSEPNFFGMKGVADYAVNMKTLGDATILHNRMLALLEQASLETDPAERNRLLTFCAAGGGFAGVETIGAVNDFLRDALKYYPDISEDEIKVILVHPSAVVLPELGEKLGRYAQKKLGERDVDIRLNTRVTGFDGSAVTLSNNETIEARTLIWTAGVKPSAIIEALPCPKEKGRVKVDEFLSVPGYPNLWAVGDCASVPDYKSGKPQPPTAQHGLRQARHAAQNMIALIEGAERTPFRFSTIGQLASIGRRTGVANIMGMNFSGFIAWFLWRSVYLMKLPRVVKKVRVAVDWTLELFFSKDFEQLLSANDIRTLAKIANQFKPMTEGAPEAEKAA